MKVCQRTLSKSERTVAMKEYTLHQLLSESSPEHVDGLRKLWDAEDTHFIVLFVDPKTEERAILTIGPNADYRELSDVAELNFDGLVPEAFVRGRHHCVTAPVVAKTGSVDEARLIAKEKELTQLENELSERQEEIRRQELEIERIRAALEERERFITESENRLSELAERHFEKEAELLQREESLRARERAAEAASEATVKFPNLNAG